LINVICDNAMINAYALDKKEIAPAFIQEVADDLCLAGTSSRVPALRRAIAVESPNGHAGNAVVPEKFFHELREALVDAMGPMAQIVLAEHVKLLGQSLDHFPREKIAGLIESVSREIFD